MYRKNLSLLSGSWFRHVILVWFGAAGYHAEACLQANVEQIESPRLRRASAEFSNVPLGRIVDNLRLEHDMPLWVDDEVAEVYGDLHCSELGYWELVKKLYDQFAVAPVINGGRVFLVEQSDLDWRERVNPLLGAYIDSSCLVQARLVRSDLISPRLCIAIHPTPNQFGTPAVLVNGVIGGRNSPKKITLSNGKFEVDAGGNTQSWRFDSADVLQLASSNPVVEGELLVLDAVNVVKVGVDSPGQFRLGELGDLDISRSVHTRKFTYGETASVYESPSKVELIRSVFTPQNSSFGGAMLPRIVFSELLSSDEWSDLALMTQDRPVVKLFQPIRWSRDLAENDKVFCKRDQDKMEIQLFSEGEIATKAIWIASYKVRRIPFMCRIFQSSR